MTFLLPAPLELLPQCSNNSDLFLHLHTTCKIEVKEVTKGSGSLNADIALVKFSTKAKKNEKNDLHADLMHTLKAINDWFPACPHEVSYRVA